MDKTLFRERLKTLGYFKRRYGDEHDEVFISTPTSSICLFCEHGWEIWIERKWGYKEKPYWRYKCRACRETWT